MGNTPTLGDLIDRARFRTLIWPRSCGPTVHHCPPVLAASFLEAPGQPARRDLRLLLEDVADAFARGGAFLLLTMHAEARDAAKAHIQRVLHQAAIAPQPAETVQ